MGDFSGKTKTEPTIRQSLDGVPDGRGGGRKESEGKEDNEEKRCSTIKSHCDWWDLLGATQHLTTHPLIHHQVPPLHQLLLLFFAWIPLLLSC